VWEKKVFVAQPGYWTQQQGGRLVIPEGVIHEPRAWDHEHRALCWKKIMEQGGDVQDGYTDGRDWLCVDCYHQYIASPDPLP
jgi:hypothetical protein